MKRLFALSLFFLLAANAHAQKVVASLDRSTVAVGEGVGFSIACENFQPTSAPRLPFIPGLRIAGAGSGRSFQLGGGQQVSTLTYNFLITPTKTGTYTLPSLTIPSNGAVHKTQPLKLRVVAANSEERKGGVSDYAFVRLVVGKNTAYVGEPVPVEIQLFLQNGRYNMPELSAEGFNMTDYPEPKSSRAQRGNAIFQVRTFQTAATPVKSGALQIGPVTMDVVLKIRQNQRRRSPFNDPFEGLLTRYQDVPATLEAKAHNITVKPLPVEGRPANFNGAVGQFAMTAKASPLEVTVGDPVTLNIQLSGEGTVDSLTLPKLAWPGFKSYEPSISSEQADPLGLSGTKVFEQVIIPENDSITEVPKIELAYFNPEEETYMTLSQGPFPLKVNPSAKPVRIPTTTANGDNSTGIENDTPPQSELLWIKHELGSLGQATPLIGRPTFWLLQSIPFLLWIGALVWRRKSEAIAGNPRLLRQRQVDQRTRNGLAKLERLADENEVQEFYTELAELLREQIGLSLDIPAEGITADVIDGPLGQAQIEPETREMLRRLFTACDAASYAASQSTAELRSCLTDLQQVINEL